MQITLTTDYISCLCSSTLCLTHSSHVPKAAEQKEKDSKLHIWPGIVVYKQKAFQQSQKCSINKWKPSALPPRSYKLITQKHALCNMLVSHHSDEDYLTARHQGWQVWALSRIAFWEAEMWVRGSAKKTPPPRFKSLKERCSRCSFSVASMFALQKLS